jgi:hypothetical protein
VVNSIMMSDPIQCLSLTSAKASACDSLVNTDIDSMVSRFAEEDIATKGAAAVLPPSDRTRGTRGGPTRIDRWS